MKKKILYPNRLWSILIIILGFGLLICVFSFHMENTIIAYVSYLLSTYALILLLIDIYNMSKMGKDYLKRSSFYGKYQEHKLIITRMSLIFSLLFNLIYGLFKLYLGVHYNSWWFITFAIYYLLLCMMKISLVKDFKKEINSNSKKEYQKLKLVGIDLILLNFVLVGIVLLIILQGETIKYDGVLIYIAALYDFILVIIAIINVIKYRRGHSPILIASKCINLVVAMISMISLESSMVYYFGNDNSSFKILMTTLMGTIVYIIILIMAIHMIIKANKRLKN